MPKPHRRHLSVFRQACKDWWLPDLHNGILPSSGNLLKFQSKVFKRPLDGPKVSLTADVIYFFCAKN